MHWRRLRAQLPENSRQIVAFRGEKNKISSRMFHDWRFQNLQLCVLRQTAHNTYNTYLTIIILFTTISFWRIMLSPRRKDWIRSRKAEWELYMLLSFRSFLAVLPHFRAMSLPFILQYRLLRDDFGIRTRCWDCASPPPAD